MVDVHGHAVDSHMTSSQTCAVCSIMEPPNVMHSSTTSGINVTRSPITAQGCCCCVNVTRILTVSVQHTSAHASAEARSFMTALMLPAQLGTASHRMACNCACRLCA